jgi:hypothetical protein
MGALELIAVSLVALSMTVVLIWPAARICRRTGHSPWLGILIVIPLINVALLWFIALSRWPTVLPERM